MTNENKGLWLGLLGVVIFSASLPMTKLAVYAADPAGKQLSLGLSAWFVTFGRAAVAGILSIFYLAFVHFKSPASASFWPARAHWGLLAFTACGVVVGFPLFTALALRSVPSMHGAVVTGLLPLATAVVAAVWFQQKPALGFWVCAAVGSLLVLAFMVLRSSDSSGLHLHAADVFLLLAMTSAALGYVGGARLTPILGAEHVICWVLVLSLPITLPMAWLNLPQDNVPAVHWWGFAYVAVFSMWIGFFAWYRGLALGGAVRVSQVQLVQPFLSILIAVPLLGEKIDLLTIGFAIAVIATVFIGKKMPVTVPVPVAGGVKP